MVIVVPQLSGPAGVMHIAVSVPHIACLIDGSGKYVEPSDVKQSDDETEKRRYRHRGPTLRSLVKLALRCQDAEEFGHRLRQRYERNARRQGIDTAGRSRRDERELAQLLGDPPK